MVPKWFAPLVLILSFFGLLDAGFLTVKHFQGTPPPCSILKGCEIVTTSQYSVILGVPVALLGTLYYLALFALALWLIDRGGDFAAKAIRAISSLGLLASLGFVYLQIFVIKAICLYCMFSATLSLVLFLAAWYALKKPKQI